MLLARFLQIDVLLFFVYVLLNYLTGIYYNYDSSTNKYHNSIMADQMAGQWYLKACELGQSPSDRVTIAKCSALKDIDTFMYAAVKLYGARS